MKLSIVTTMYFSAPYLKEFYERAIKSAKKITDDYEIIFVNDGSTDNSLKSAIELLTNEDNIKIIDLSRNFGHHKAIMTGLTYAKGDYIFLIDCDLEDEPELLERYWAEIQNEKDLDVIYGVQKKRKGGWFERVSGEMFFDLFNYLSDTKIVKNFINARLMTKRYVKNLIKYKERELAIFGVYALTGFNQKVISVEKHFRGSSSYSLKKKIDLAINSFASFTNKPLVYIFYIGSILTLFSFMYALSVLIKKIIWGVSVTGWTSLTVSLWFLGGIIIFSIGVVGIYISKIFIETKNRPYVIIKDIYSNHKL